MHRRGRAREVVDLVHLDKQRKGHVVTDEFEARVGVQMRDIALGAGEQVVNTDDLVPICEQAVTQMRPEEAGTTGNEDPFACFVIFHRLIRIFVSPQSRRMPGAYALLRYARNQSTQRGIPTSIGVSGT